MGKKWTEQHRENHRRGILRGLWKGCLADGFTEDDVKRNTGWELPDWLRVELADQLAANEAAEQAWIAEQRERQLAILKELVGAINSGIELTTSQNETLNDILNAIGWETRTLPE